jgi:hypothetical protein
MQNRTGDHKSGVLSLHDHKDAISAVYSIWQDMSTDLQYNTTFPTHAEPLIPIECRIAQDVMGIAFDIYD